MMTQIKITRRAVDGLILLDKPIGLSSNKALQQVRLLFQAEKAGHTGALDPLATGVLPICLGETTKVAGLLLGEDKAYEVTAQLGQTTDTDDSEGQVLVSRAVGEYSRLQLEKIGLELSGAIMQVPPMYSALKQGGEPMYRKARRGEAIDLPARLVHIHRIDVLEHTLTQVRLRVVCGSGTYIRSLVRDIGEHLGCGAHVSVLRRIWVSPFQATKVWTLEQLQNLAEHGLEVLDQQLLPVEHALQRIPAITLNAEQARRVGMGQKIHMPNLNAAQDLIQLLDDHARCLGLASIDAQGMIKVKRLFTWAAIC